MLDAPARRRLLPALEPVAAALEARGGRAWHATAAGLAVGVAACLAAGFAVWPVALALWLGNRALDGLDGAPDVRAAIESEGRALEGRGRVLVRPSGTEPLIRVMVEAPDEEECEAVTARLVDVVQAELGA